MRLILSIVAIVCALLLLGYFIWLAYEQKRGCIFTLHFNKETSQRIADFAEDHQLTVDELFLRAVEKEMVEYRRGGYHSNV